MNFKFLFGGNRDLRKYSTSGCWSIINCLQACRYFWLFMLLSALCLEAVALFYQYVLAVLPCEYCVYQRLALLILAVAFLSVCINPDCLVYQLFGFSLGIWGGIYGLNSALEQLMVYENTNPLFITCNLKPHFPFQLQLDEWLPSLFKPMALCHETPPNVMGISMPQWMVVVFSGYLALFSIFLFNMCRNWNKTANRTAY